jgi:hypothetical protein
MRCYWLKRNQSDVLKNSSTIYLCSDILLLTELSKTSEIWWVVQCLPPTKISVINTDETSIILGCQMCSLIISLFSSSSLVSFSWDHFMETRIVSIWYPSQLSLLNQLLSHQRQYPLKLQRCQQHAVYTAVSFVWLHRYLNAPYYISL